MDNLQNLINIVYAADELENYLAKNSGVSADWPIDIKCRDEESSTKLNELLNKLHQALKTYRNKEQIYG